LIARKRKYAAKDPEMWGWSHSEYDWLSMDERTEAENLKLTIALQQDTTAEIRARLWRNQKDESES
jgi:hypothetical protein